MKLQIEINHTWYDVEVDIQEDYIEIKVCDTWNQYEYVNDTFDLGDIGDLTAFIYDQVINSPQYLGE